MANLSSPGTQRLAENALRRWAQSSVSVIDRAIDAGPPRRPERPVQARMRSVRFVTKQARCQMTAPGPELARQLASSP